MKFFLVINFGTSGQICRSIDRNQFEIPKKSNQTIKSIDFVPFFDENQFLMIAATLNGGNVLNEFINHLQSIVKVLTKIELRIEDIWDRLIESFDSKENYDWQLNRAYRIKPNLFGERFDPNRCCSIEFFHRWPNLLEFVSTLCVGLIKNLIEMMPDFTQTIRINEMKRKKTLIICAGSLFNRNPFMKMAMERIITEILTSNENKCNKKGFDKSNNSGEENEEKCEQNQINSLIELKFIENCDAQIGMAINAFKQIYLK